jgi:phosphatidylglycerophosphate synthase
MYIFSTIVRWGWCPIVITVLAIIGYQYKWPLLVLAAVLVAILIIGLTVAITVARERAVERASIRLKQLAGYFNRRFTGDSAVSIFVIIRSLLTSDNARVWGWARETEVAQRIFNTWCDSFTDRVESDIRTRRFVLYLRTYQSELWLINSHYYEFMEQFCEVAQSMPLPVELIDQYNRLVEEYNAFIQNFRDNIAELRRVARTEIEPPSVKFAKALPAAGRATLEEETKPVMPPPKKKRLF